MTIADLFVNLGVKGEGPAQKALHNVKSGLGEIKDMSLEAKAAIIGAIYGLEHLMSASAQRGTDLTQFAALTGLSAESLQRWQHAALQAGVSSEDLTGSIKGVQGAMTNMLLGKGAPEGLAMVANKVGFDMNRARDSFYVMQQLQKFAQTVPADVSNNLLKSFGVSEGTIQAMRRNAFNPSALAHSPVYSDKERERLDKTNIAYKNLGVNIEMALGRLTAKHGMTLLKDISAVTKGVLKMVDSFVTLGEKLEVFKILTAVFEGWGKIFELIGGVADSLGEHTSGKNNDVKKGQARGQNLPGMNAVGDFVTRALSGVPTIPRTGFAEAQGINIEQNITHYGDAKDTKAVKDSHQKIARDAYRQMHAQSQGN